MKKYRTHINDVLALVEIQLTGNTSRAKCAGVRLPFDIFLTAFVYHEIDIRQRGDAIDKFEESTIKL